MALQQVSVNLDPAFVKEVEDTAARQRRSLSGMLAWMLYEQSGWRQKSGKTEREMSNDPATR